MNTRNRSLLFSFFISLVIAGSAIYLLVLKSPIRKTTAQLFEPVSVVKLGWSVEEKKIEFTRADALSKWTPEVAPSRIDTKIFALSQLTLQHMNPPEAASLGSVSVTLTFQNGSSWSGIYKDEVFVWTSGPLAKQGAQLNPAEAEIFQEGRYAFDPLEWSWCPPRLRKLVFELDEEAVEIERNETHWEITNLNGESKMVDSIWLTAWLEKACQAPVRLWVDLEVKPAELDNGSLELELVDGSQFEYAVSPATFQISEQKAAIAPTFFQYLEELLEAP